MTTPVDGASRADRDELGWRKWLTRQRAVGAATSIFVKPALTAAATFIVTAIVVGMLRDPIDHRLVPTFLEYTHQEQALHLYPLKASGTYEEPGETYALFVPTSGASRAGRMIERLESGLNPKYDYVVSGSEQSGIVALSFRPFDGNKTGGGTFIGSTNHNGYFVGLLTGLAHDDRGGPCKLTYYLAVLGHPANAHRFAAVLNEMVKVNPAIIPTATVQATEFTGTGECGYAKGVRKTGTNN